MLCCRGSNKEEENATLVTSTSSSAGRSSTGGGGSSKSAKNGQQQRQQQPQAGRHFENRDGRRSSGDGDSDDHFQPYGSGGSNVHFNVGFQQQQQQQQPQQQHHQCHTDEFQMEDASTWRRQTTSTFFGDDNKEESKSASLRRSQQQQQQHLQRPPSAFDVDVIEVRTSNDGGAATIATSGASAASHAILEEDDGADLENVVVAPPPPLPPPTAISEDEECREEREMKIRLLNDSSVSDASSFREDCPDLDVVVDVVDPSRPVRTVEIIKNPGESLGFYIREGDGVGQENGVFISRMTPESPLEKSRLLNVGDEILTVNSINVSKMNLDDVVVIMSIPKRLVLLVRSRARSSGASDLPAYYLHQQSLQRQQRQHLHHLHPHQATTGGDGAAVSSSSSFLSQRQHEFRRRGSQYRAPPSSVVGSSSQQLRFQPGGSGANSLPRGLPGNLAAAAEIMGSDSQRYSAHIFSAAFGDASHVPPTFPQQQQQQQPHVRQLPGGIDDVSDLSAALGRLDHDFPCDINAMKMSTLERKGKIEKGNHLLKEHLKWDPCFEKDEALGQSIGSPSPSGVPTAMVPTPLIFDRIRQSSFRSSSSGATSGAASSTPLKTSTSHLQHLQHFQAMQHHLQQPLYVGATHVEFGSTPQEDSNDSGHVSEVSGGGVCDPHGDVAHSAAGGGDAARPFGGGGSGVEAMWKRNNVIGGGGVVSFESDVIGGRSSSNVRDDLTSLLYGTSGRIAGLRQLNAAAAAQTSDVPVRRLSHTSSMSRVTAASYAPRTGHDDDSSFSTSLLSAQSLFARNPLTPPPSTAGRGHPQSKYVNIHVNRLFGGHPPAPSKDDLLFHPTAALGFPIVTSSLKRHGSETEVNRAGVDFDRIPLFHSQQRRPSPQRRFGPPMVGVSAAPPSSISKSVTIASAANHLQNHPTISSSSPRDPGRAYGSLGRGSSAGDRAQC